MTQWPANWYPDPLGRYELRYWDGDRWTDHVATQGVQALDPLAAAQAEQAAQRAAERAAQAQARAAALQAGRRQEAWRADAAPGAGEAGALAPRDGGRAGVRTAAGPGGGTPLSEPVLVVSHDMRAAGDTGEHTILDQVGRPIGRLREVRRGGPRKALGRLSSADQPMIHTLQIIDPHGDLLLQVVRSGRFRKGRVVVQDREGHEVGQIVQQSVWGKSRFALESGGHQHGALDAEDWGVCDFVIRDQAGDEVVRISKAAPTRATARFTGPDDYVVQIDRAMDEPLRSLALAAALAVDTALRHDIESLG